MNKPAEQKFRNIYLVKIVIEHSEYIMSEWYETLEDAESEGRNQTEGSDDGSYFDVIEYLPTEVHMREISNYQREIDRLNR